MFLFFTSHFKKCIRFDEPETFYSHHWSLPGRNNNINGYIKKGTAVAQWFRSHYGPGVASAFNRNEYQEHFLGLNAADA